MSPDSRLRDLLDAWRLAFLAGQDLTAEELCDDCPELIPEVRRQIEQARRAPAPSTVSLDHSTSEPPGEDTHTRTPGTRLAVEPWLPVFPGYETLGHLGEGGMGVVYAARRPTGEVVALKTLQQMTADGLFRFKQEFRLVSELSHPNLIGLRELVSDGGTWFFTMELLHGVDLLTHVRGHRGASADLPAVCDRLRHAVGGLATALAALHAAGVLHRDVKPRNVMVTDDGRVVLLDFGLAGRMTAGDVFETANSARAGTPAYMAPEQAAAQDVSPAADWYAVGVVLYQALAGQLPFGGTTAQVLWAKQQADPPPPSHLRPGVPAEWDRLCVDLLARDPARRPKGAEVLRRLGVAEAVSSGVATANRLIGRDDQLAALGRAFALLNGGGTVCVRVHGPSGSGKSSLAREFLDRAAADGAVALRGRCYEQELVPYKAFDGVIDALSRHLLRLPDAEVAALLPRQAWAVVRLFPVLGRVERFKEAARNGPPVPDQQEVRRRGVAALRELFARLGDGLRRVVVFIDDLQWGDADSGVLLDELLRQPDSPRLLLILGYRSEDAAVRPLLQATARIAPAPPGLEVIDLPVGGLADADARALAARLLGESDGRAETIAREAGGNPFYIRMLAKAARDGSAIESNLSLTQVLWDSTRALAPDEQRLLEVAAVAGRPIRLEVARRAVGAVADFYAVQVGLRAGQLVRGTGLAADDVIAPYHDRVRETVLAHLTPDARRGWHLRLARALEEVGELDPEFLAVHFHGGGENRTAAGYYAHAAEVAAGKTAFDRAVELFRLAVELGDWPADEKARLKAGAAAALVNAGRGKAAAEAYLAAAELAGRDRAIEWKRLAAEQYLISGHIDVGVEVLKEVVAAVGLPMPRTPFRALLGYLWLKFRLRLRGYGFRPRAEASIPPEELHRVDVCFSAAKGLLMSDLVRGIYYQANGSRFAIQTGEPGRIAQAIASAGAEKAIDGPTSYSSSELLLQLAESITSDTKQPTRIAMVALFRGDRDMMAGRFRSAARVLESAERMLVDSCTGVAWELDTCRYWRLICLFHLGEWAEVAEQLPKLLEDARGRGDLFAEAHLGAAIQTIVRLAEDDPQRAIDGAHAAMAGWSQQGFHMQHANHMEAIAMIKLYCGEGATCLEAIADKEAFLRRSFLWRVQIIRIDILTFRALAALVAARTTAAPESFLRSAAKDARKLSRESAAWSKALGALVAACVQASRKSESGSKWFAEAVRQLEAVDLGAYAAAARYRLGERTAGEKGERLCEEAVGWLKKQGVVNPLRIIKSYAPIGRPEDHPDLSPSL